MEELDRNVGNEERRRGCFASKPGDDGERISCSRNVLLRQGVRPVEVVAPKDSDPGSENRTRFLDFVGVLWISICAKQCCGTASILGLPTAGFGSARAELLRLLRRTAIGLSSATSASEVCVVDRVILDRFRGDGRLE